MCKFLSKFLPRIKTCYCPIRLQFEDQIKFTNHLTTKSTESTNSICSHPSWCQCMNPPSSITNLCSTWSSCVQPCGSVNSEILCLVMLSFMDLFPWGAPSEWERLTWLSLPPPPCDCPGMAHENECCLDDCGYTVLFVFQGLGVLDLATVRRQWSNSTLHLHS